MRMSESNDFSASERDAVYRAISTRRDVRSQFVARPVPPKVLHRILDAAHQAPSVGFSQPWDFLVIESRSIRESVKAEFDRMNAAASKHYAGERRQLYGSLKLEGILEAPLNVCVTCDRERGGPHVLGRNSVIDADLYSTCLAVQNLWLAARAEGIGVGWVTILDYASLARLLELPPQVVPVAYLCVGYVSRFLAEPELQSAGWATRDPLASRVHLDRWGESMPVRQGRAGSV
jgi:5,6-dimethylbenzimidazole synthase